MTKVLKQTLECYNLLSEVKLSITSLCFILLKSVGAKMTILHSFLAFRQLFTEKGITRCVKAILPRLRQN